MVLPPHDSPWLTVTMTIKPRAARKQPALPLAPGGRHASIMLQISATEQFLAHDQAFAARR